MFKRISLLKLAERYFYNTHNEKIQILTPLNKNVINYKEKKEKERKKNDIKKKNQ